MRDAGFGVAGAGNVTRLVIPGWSLCFSRIGIGFCSNKGLILAISSQQRGGRTMLRAALGCGRRPHCKEDNIFVIY